jgi:hypothetical protein
MDDTLAERYMRCVTFKRRLRMSSFTWVKIWTRSRLLHWPNGAFMAHCHRELYHAQWATILDGEFLDAYVQGIVIDCYDGIRRRFYPHIPPTIVRSTYHPVKHLDLDTQIYRRILIGSIRNLGRCPCPRCLIPLDRVVNMGQHRDMTQRETLARVDDVSRRNRVASAREIIYEKNYAVDSKAVDNLLQVDSLVPTAVRDADRSLLLSGHLTR